MNLCHTTTPRLRTAAPLALLAAVMALVASPALAQKTGTLSTPSIACDSEKSQVSIWIDFVAGSPTGAPAGFSLQWMTQQEYLDNGEQWYLSSDPRLCKGSFSGNAFGHVYNLPAGGASTIQIGDALFDNPGASSNCASEPLICGTTYRFRAFSHATSKLFRSAWSNDLLCRTKACTEPVACVYTQGYWKTHGPVPTGNNQNEWPVGSLTLGTFSYTDLQLLDILNRPAQGNGLVALAHQLIAAKLNIANGASDTAVAGAIAAADALIGGLVVPPVGSGFLHPSLTSGLNNTLTSYNEGSLPGGPSHCG